MKSRAMSIAICLLLITSISAPITQNVGQSQSIGKPTSSSSGTRGFVDSPWPMFGYNAQRTGLSPYDTSSNNGQLKWSFETGDFVRSPVVRSDGTIFVCSQNHKLYAINPDGTEKWNFILDGHMAISPAIGTDGTIYAGSTNNVLFALNPDGTEKWHFATSGKVSYSPAIGSDSTIYVPVMDGSLYALNPDGTEKWRFSVGTGYIGSPTIAFDGTIYIGSNEGKLYALNPDGTEKWKFYASDNIQNAPSIGPDGTIYTGSNDHNVYAINPDGTEKWRFTAGGPIGWSSSPAISSDCTIYVGSDDKNLYAINLDGTEKWRFHTGGLIQSAPAIGSEGTIYFGSDDFNIYAINPDGSKKWNFTTGFVVHSSPAIGSDGTIYIGSCDKKLYAIGNLNPNLDIEVTSHFSELNSAAQSLITVHVTDGTNPVQGATVNLVSDNGGIFSPQSGITDANGDFKSIFNAPTVTSQIICRISAEASKMGYNDGSGYVDVTVNPIPWPMYSQNCRRTGLSPYDTSSNPGKLKWSYTTDGFVMSPVIGSDETIYVVSSDYKLYAINPDGTQKWNFTVEGYVDKSPDIGSDGTIYVGSGIKNKLYALTPDGIEKWYFTANGRVSSSAIGSDGTIYFSTSDLPGPNPLLYALHPNGIEKWKLPIGVNGRGYAPALASDGTIYVGTGEGKLYAVYPNGTEKWTFSAMNNMQNAPAIGSDGIIYIASSDYNLYAINPDGTEKWRFNAGDCSDSSPAIGYNGTIYIGSNDRNLYAINPNGTEKWRFTANSLIQTSPAIGSDGTIYVGSDDSNLYAINPDGTEKWNFTTGWFIHSSPAIGSDGTIYVGSGDKKLYAIGGFAPNIIVEKTANVTVVKPGDLIEYTIWYNNTATGTVTSAGSQQLTFEDFHQYTADISVDGTKILYSATINLNHDIWIMDIDGTNHQQLTFESYLQREPSYSPDGTKIVYSSTEDGDAGYEDIWVMDSDGSNHVQLTSNYETQRYPKFSPDGSRIIYASQENGDNHLDIWVMDSDGSNKKQLTFDNNPQTCPVFSPDGMKIAYQSWEAGDSFSNIWIMDSDGSNHQQLTFEGQSTSMPRFSPNGNWVVYTVLNKIYIVDINGNNKQLIDDTQGAKGWALFDRSGNKLFYSAYEAGGGFLDIWTLDLEYSNDPAHTVWINDTLPPGTTFITSSAEANRTGDYNWTFYNVEPGEHHFTITVQVNNNVLNGTILTNYVHLDYTNFEGIQMPRSLDSVDVMVLAPENLPPTADAGSDQTIDEGDTLQFNGSSSYDLDGTIETYEWDFDASDGLCWEASAVPDATGPTPTHIYGDDGVYIVTLRVTDNDNLSATDTCNVTVQNVDPTVTIESITMEAEIGLRVAGRKYNNVSMALYEDGSQLGYVSIERMPGSPDEQMAWIPVSINFSKSCSATVTYTPEDPPNIGGNPVWIYIKSQNGSIKKIHHTFNVQQSKKRDSEHWNHVEPWEVDLNVHFIGLSFEITSHITDPGSDDETLTFTYGSQVKTVTYLTNPPNPDPYPSPEVNPVDIMDTTTLVYEGPGTVMLVVEDDDGGLSIDTLDV